MRDYNNNIYTALVCRICLCKGNELNIMQCDLLLFYEKIKNIWVQDENLPQGVCWECVVRLASAATFRDKALESEQMLYRMLRRDLYANNLRFQAQRNQL